MTKLYHQINTGIRSDQVQAIKKQAHDNRRTMKAEIEVIFDAYFEQKKNTEEKQNEQHAAI